MTLSTLSAALGYGSAGRPLEKFVLVLLAGREGMEGEPFPVELHALAEQAEMSVEQVRAVLDDLVRHEVVRLELCGDEVAVALRLGR